MKRIAVFCGSGTGTNPIYSQIAKEIGSAIASRNYGLVYGGASVGLMGIIADEVLAQGGEVIGVIPNDLKRKEIAHLNLSKLIEVHSMHERKQVMSELSDAVIALPGGFGTLDELFEMLTWSQLGYHSQPIALCNVERFYDHLIAHIDQMVSMGFLKPIFRSQLIIEHTPLQLLDQIEAYQHRYESKWIDIEENHESPNNN